MTNSLLVSQGKNLGKRFELSGHEFLIGRDAASSVCVADIEVSRTHCRIQVQGDRYILTDLGSSNGTYVNDVRVARHELKFGDKIRIGSTELVFEPNGLSEQTTVDIPSQIQSAKLTPVGDAVLEAPAGSRLSDDSTYYDFKTGEEEASRRFVQVGNDLRFLYNASLTTSRKTDIQEMLDDILSLVFNWIAADRGCVILKNPKYSTFDIRSFKSRTEMRDDQEFRVSQSITHYVRRVRAGVLSSNPMTDERWGSQESERNLKIGEVICVPILGRDEVLGLIYIDTIRQHGDSFHCRFNEDHLRLMIALAHQASVAIENEANYRALLEKERLAAIGETTAALAHHIKNTIQGINGGSHLIESGLHSRDLVSIEKGWQIVNRNQEQISRLVIDMLMIGRPYEPIREPADLNLAVEEAIQQLAYPITVQQARCAFHPLSTLQKFSFEFTGVTSAIYHVINCSLMACRKMEGAIDVSVVSESGGATVIVEDNGEIIDLSKSLTVLEPFGIGSEHNTYEIGLLVARKILAAHGGEIQLASSADRNGNRITIWFPFA